MIISGFQPLSLLDYPGTVCSIIFTQGCPLRCVYCHNPELLPVKSANRIPEDTVFSTLKKRKNVVEGVCVTGGEPTIHHDLPEFIKKLKDLGLQVKLDTNGVNPRMIEKLIQDKLVDFFAMDLKHTWERYSEVIGTSQNNIVANCQETFHLIQDSSIPHEFRTTVYPELHSENDLVKIANQLIHDEHYSLQGIRYQKTLVPNLPQSRELDLDKVSQRIRAKQPNLRVEVRT